MIWRTQQEATERAWRLKRIIDECYDRARHIIRKYDDVLHACADLLLEKEKISREEFEALFPEDVSED